jgi:hypothetical protein
MSVTHWNFDDHASRPQDRAPRYLALPQAVGRGIGFFKRKILDLPRDPAAMRKLEDRSEIFRRTPDRGSECRLVLCRVDAKQKSPAAFADLHNETTAFNDTRRER